MRYTRHLFLLALALLVSLNAFTTVKANPDEDQSDYRIQARVARISLLSGDVQVQRAGSRELESASVNLPLVEGDALTTGRDSHLEIQIDAYNFVRVGENSSLVIVTLRDEGVALSLAEGTASLRLARFDREHEYFEVDLPKTTVAAEARGLFRLDAGSGGSSRREVSVTVRDGGRARIYSDTSGFTLREGRTARLYFDGDESGDWDLASAREFDSWDEWVEQREHELAERLRYEGRDRYYDSGVWGAEELDAYGDWVDAGSYYGYVWRPRVTVINNYYNWAPYRYGYWRWCEPYGWVWIAAEPWGWAPYHYGRWVYYNGSWCWSPYSYYYGRHHSWWHPALVVFVEINNQVCWYPVPHHYPDPVYVHVKGTRASTGPIASPRGSFDLPASGPRNTTPNSPPPVKPTRAETAAYLNAVTSTPLADFGGPRHNNIQPVPKTLAQTVVASDPVAVTDLPVRPVRGTKNNSSLDAPVRTRDTSTSTVRPTGAAVRKPGVALDDELRKTRLYNGREPVRTKGTDGGNVKSDGTGAVTRPPRTYTKPPVTDNGGGSVNSEPVRPPVRPSNPKTRDDSSVDTGGSNNSEPVRPPKPERPQVSQPPPPSEPPTRRPEKRREEQSAPVRTSPPVRESPPPPRNDPPPPPPKQESPRSSPPPAKLPDAPVKKGKDGRD